MTFDPRPAAVSPGEIRAQARRQARTLSGGLMAVLGGLVALLLVVALVALDYRFDQDAHRLFKLVLGGAAAVWVVLVPRIGLFLLPVAMPFLGWMPRIPIPMLNAVNILIFAVFFSWIVSGAIARKSNVRSGHLGAMIALFIGVTLLELGRGIAFPITRDYDGGAAAMTWFRSSTAFVVYYMGYSMLRGASDRRRMAMLIAVTLGIEAVTVFALGRNGSAGRSVGTFDQPNVLGTFLSMFICVTAAMVRGTNKTLWRLVLIGITGIAVVAIFPSLSRGAMLAVAIGLAYVTLRTSPIMTAVLVLLLLTSPLWAPQEVKDRITSTQVESDEGDGVQLEASAQKRLNTWEVILRVVADHPLDGVGYAGIGNVLVSEGIGQGVEGIARTAHNSFLRMLGEGGIFGLMALVGLFWSCWKLSLDGTRLAADRFGRQLAVGFGGATLALAVGCWFGDRFFDIGITGNFWLLGALIQDQVVERRRRKA